MVRCKEKNKKKKKCGEVEESHYSFHSIAPSLLSLFSLLVCQCIEKKNKWLGYLTSRSSCRFFFLPSSGLHFHKITKLIRSKLVYSFLPLFQRMPGRAQMRLLLSTIASITVVASVTAEQQQPRQQAPLAVEKLIQPNEHECGVNAHLLYSSLCCRHTNSPKHSHLQYVFFVLRLLKHRYRPRQVQRSRGRSHWGQHQVRYNTATLMLRCIWSKGPSRTGRLRLCPC